MHEASKNDDNIMETKLIETVSKNEGKEEMSAKNYIEENSKNEKRGKWNIIWTI